MTAFLFIPTQAGVTPTHRVNFANIATLFAEPDEPAARKLGWHSRMIAAFAVIVLALLGDAILVARPTMAGASFLSPPVHGRITS